MDGPENYLAHLEKQVADLRKAGLQPTQAALDAIEVQKKNVAEDKAGRAARLKGIADQEAAKDAAHLARQEDALKANALAAFTASGGAPGEFEAMWPELRKKVIEQSTLDRMAGDKDNQAAQRRRTHVAF